MSTLLLFVGEICFLSNMTASLSPYIELLLPLQHYQPSSAAVVTESVVDQLLFDHQNCSFLRYLPSGYKEFPKIYYKQTLEGYPYTSTVQILEWRQVRDKYPGWTLERKLQNFLSWFFLQNSSALAFQD